MYKGKLWLLLKGIFLVYIYEFFLYIWKFFFLEIYMSKLFKYLFFFIFVNKKGVKFNNEVDVGFLCEMLMLRWNDFGFVLVDLMCLILM